jgi:POT family proton-dependent oligopeptide transporter
MEYWERFSYYGMRALLILYMTAETTAGGLKFNVVNASAIYGLYTSLVYMTGLPGGWIADRFIGQRRAVLVGGIIIAMGHFCLAVHGMPFFYSGLGLIIIGTGLLKPNVSSMVGSLYDEDDVRRDAGFSIFYMGINLGAMIAPLICGYLGQKVDWHYGFGAAGFGMLIGVVQYSMGGKYLGRTGLEIVKPDDPAVFARQKRNFGLILTGFVLLCASGIYCEQSGLIDVSVQQVVGTVGIVLVLLPIFYFVSIFAKGGWTTAERKRIWVVAILFIFTALFWAAFEQAGSTLNLFADRFTHNELFGFAFPSSWYQSVNSLFIIAFAPVFAWLWIKLRNHEPSSPAKFSFGLLGVGLGYLLLVPAALIVVNQKILVSPFWLVGVYLLHSFGELALSPVGLSMVTKLAPVRIVSQMMGIWFLTISVGNFVGGQVAGLFETLPLPTLFGAVAGTTIGAALLLAILVKPIKRLMGGVN